MSAPNPSPIVSGTVVAWDGPTRVFKWALVALVFMGWLSNAIGGATPNWHKWNGYAVLILIVFRLLWGVVGGASARFSLFVRGPGAAIAYARGLISGAGARYLGHNPLGAWMVVALLIVIALQGVTGLYSADEDRLIISGPLAKTVSDAAVSFASRWHHKFFDLLQVLIAVHVGAALFYQYVKKDRLITAMTRGVKPREPYIDLQETSGGGWGLAAVCLVCATAVVLGAILLLERVPAA